MKKTKCISTIAWVSGIFGAALSLSATLSQADVPTSETDTNGMPLCILKSDGQEFLKFEWKNDPFERDVYAETSPRIGYQAATGAQLQDLYETQCLSHERTFDSSKRVSSTRVLLAANQANVLGYSIPADTTSLLAQVRLGGNVARGADQATPAAFFSSSITRGSKYSVELNRELTAKYGMGFSAGIYKAFVENDPLNGGLKQKVLGYIDQEKAKGISDLKSRFPGVTFALARGYAFRLGNNARFRDLTQDMIDFGLDVKVMNTDPFGSSEANRAEIVSELKGLIAAGKKIVVLGGSKGGSEALGAVSDLNSPQIIAVLSLSAMVQGSFAVDWAGSEPKWEIIKNTLYKEFNSQGGNLTSKSQMNSFRDMRTKTMASFFESHPISNARSAVYLNLVGTPLGNGLTRDDGVREVQDKVIRPFLASKCGANDGYIEFPGTEVPRSLGLTTYTLAFNSSHPILDGDFEGYTMAEKSSRQMVLRAIFNSLADLL